MAQQENLGEPAPLDVDPYLPPNDGGVPVDLQSIDGESSAASLTQLSAVEAAALELGTRVGPNYYLPLYHAATRGDWKSARSLVGFDTNLWTATITTKGETVLMVAARACQWKFVEKLVEIVPPEALAMQDTTGHTVLHMVAAGESIKTAKALVRKNSGLTQLKTFLSWTPLVISVVHIQKEMAWYLALVTRDEHPSRTCPFTSDISGWITYALTVAGFNDITMYLLQHYPNLAFAGADEDRHILKCLSNTPWSFLSGSKLTILERLIYKFVQAEIELPPYSQELIVLNSLGNMEGLSEITISKSRSFISQVSSLKKVREAKLQHICATNLVMHVCKQLGSSMSFQQVAFYLKDVMYSATRFGIVEIVRTCLHHFPDMIVLPLVDEQNILQVAINCRQDKIFNLLVNEMRPVGRALAFQDDKSENSVWHLAAKLAPHSQLLSISGAALQMQRELQWFKEVEKLVNPIFKDQVNEDGKTSMDVFMEEHKELAEKGEKWMKDTANSCMIVSTLIATVVFAAAFTVPGGNISDRGIPIFINNNLFIVFAISDALALFSSSTSLLMFLSILTARYAYEDFLLKLPRRLIIGLASLFFAIITMMVAFGATLFMVLNERWQWVYIPIIVLGCMPVLIFAKQQVPLLYDMIQSTYGSGIFKKKKRWQLACKWKCH